MARMMVGGLLLCAMMACHAMGQSQEELLDVTGKTINFYATFDIVDAELGFSYPFGFFFGNGWSGDSVRTDTQVTLGRNGNSSQIFACRNGQMILIDVSPEGTPQDALVRVRYNSTDEFYRIEITESSDSALQLAYCSNEGILCSQAPATPILFQLNSNYQSLRRRRAASAHAALM